MSWICGGGPLSRGIWKCMDCGKRARQLTQHSFGGYVTTTFCGHCGAAKQDGELLRSDKKDRARHIQYVKDNWKHGLPLRLVLDELLKDMQEEMEGQRLPA